MVNTLVVGEKQLLARWYRLLSIGGVLVGAAVWFGLPGDILGPARGPIAILIGLLPRFVLLAHKKFPFRWTAFDIPLLIFLATAAASVLISYNQPGAFTKFWPLFLGVLLFYGLAEQPGENLWKIAGLFSALGALLGVYFFLSSQGLAASNETDPDLYSGTLVVVVPLSLAFSYYRWQLLAAQNRTGKTQFSAWLGFVLAGLFSLMILAAVFVTAEWSAWIGVGLVVGTWTWGQISKILAMRFAGRQWGSISGLSQRRIFWVGLVFLAVLCLPFVFTQPRFSSLIKNALGSRTALWQGALGLVADFPFSGGGLESFGGLYSQYIQVTPFKFTSSSNNLFLEVAVEQGVAGAAALLVILVGSLRQLLARPAQDNLSQLRKAVLAGLLLLIFQGLVETSLYGHLDAWLLFFLPGLAVAGSPDGRGERKLCLSRRQYTAGLILPALVLTGIVLNWQPLLAGIYSNWGAVQMARVELDGFPTGKWDKGQRVALLEPAEDRFEQALHLDPGNLTAHYRLGLISMLRRDYVSASINLEIAHEKAPNHRGIRKNLGYTYLWLGDLEKAIPILDQLPEVNNELKAYEIWWQARSREDLANLARRAFVLLDN